jgi:hypothetical protein
VYQHGAGWRFRWHNANVIFKEIFMRINYKSPGAPTSEQNESGSVKQDIVLDIHRLALGHAPKSDNDKSKCKAASRVLAWLGMATLDKTKQFNCKPGYLLKLYGADSLKGQRRSKSQRTVGYRLYRINHRCWVGTRQ